jgi:hypothetical protein
VRTPFDIVRTVGLALPGVEAATKYDGSPVLKVGGRFMAGLATHPSAEPDTLVVRTGYDERESLIDDVPQTYYLTNYYRRHPVVLARLSRIERDALRDLLSMSWRMTLAKVRKRGRSPRSPMLNFGFATPGGESAVDTCPSVAPGRRASLDPSH